MHLPILRCCAIVCVAALQAAAAELPPGFFQMRKIDAHSHIFEEVPEVNAMLREFNMRTVNVCNNGTDGHLDTMHAIALEQYRRHPDLFPFMSTFDLLRRDESTYVQEVNTFLDRTFAQGAVAVKIWKEMGMEIKDSSGKFIMPDDPRFDSIYAHIAKRGKVLVAHLAEPIDAWRPLDPNSNHYHYYSQHPEWHLYGKPGYPSHESIIAARDNILRKHPALVVVGAHLGSMEHDLEAIAERLEKYPNFHIEVAARTRNLMRHPSEKVRALFLRFPDRILYGVDTGWKPYLRPEQRSDAAKRGMINRLRLQYEADWRYYAGRGEMTLNGRKTRSLELPPAILEKFYHGNAERLYQLDNAWAGEAGK